MENNHSFGKWYSAYLALFILVLLIAPKLTSVLFVAFIPLAYFGVKQQYFQFKLQLISLFFIATYLMYAFYCVFTRNTELAGNYLEYKLSFVIFPFIFSFIPKYKVNVQLPIIGFLLGSLHLIFAGFIGSYYCDCGTSLGISCYFSSRFSLIHHPSYTSVYFTCALFLVWYSNRMRFNWMPTWGALLLSLLFVLGIGLCLSLAGMLYFILAVAVTMLLLIYYKWGKGFAISFLVISPLLLLLMVRFIPQLQSEWNGAKKYADEYVTDPEAFIRNKKFPMSGSEVRLVMWSASFKVFNDYPFGVGTGNVDEVLINYLNKLDQRELAKQNYNPHNQYLQTGIEIGWIGLLLLISPLLIGLFIARKYHNWLLLLLVTNLMFNMMFESMLQRQSGIMFFTMGICFLAMFSSFKLFPEIKSKSSI